MKVIFTFLGLFAILTTQAQQNIVVTGSVKADDGKALVNATVTLSYIGSKDTLKAITNAKGVYTFTKVKPTKAVVTISYIGFKKFVDTYDFTGATSAVNNNDVIMTPGSNTLETVTIESARVQIKEDTVSYKIDSTMFRKNDNVEQILKNLPGVQVDKDGKVTAQGKEVTKVKVNGKEFFGGDVTTATRQLNADMVDKVQIIDDYGDQAAFTGIKDGDPTKTLNIQLKKDKNKGYFGNVSLGGGTEERYQTSLSVNRFNNNQQISVFGNLNNTNASLFNFGNLTGGAGAIAGSMIRAFGGAGSPFGGLGSSDGIGVTKSIGANYRDEISPKLSLYGSYSFSQKANTVLNNVNQINIQRDSSQLNQQQTTDYSVTDNHRFSFNVEYKIDSFNYIKINPNVTYRKVSDDYQSAFNFFDSKGSLRNNGTNKDFNTSQTPNISGSILFNHRFKKKGRTLSLNFTGGGSGTDANDDIVNTTIFYNNGTPVFNSIINQNITQNNNNHNYGVSASFNEQLTKKRSLEFNYAYNRRFVGNDKETFDVNGNSKTMVDSLTNILDNIYTTNRFGVNFRTTEKKYNYSVGLAVQPATIESNTLTGNKLQYKQNIVNFFPVVRFAYNFSKSRSFNLNYNGSSNQPTYQQLQPVYDFSNRQNIILGNPNLRPEFTNTFSMRYNNFDFISGKVFFGNISASLVSDKIVSNVLPKGFGLQETRYLNAKGYYNVNAFYTYSIPFKNRKYVVNYGGTVNYNNNISFINFEKNTGKNWIVAQRFSTDYKLKKWLETSAGFNFTFNENKYSLVQSSNSNSNIKAFNITHSSRMFFKNDVNFSYDLEKTINKGYADNVVANPLIINGTLEKSIFKKKNAAIKAQVFDLLNQNTSVSRNVTAYSITDTRSNRLGRYYLLTFVFRFSKFDGSKAGANMQMGGPGGGMRMMGGPGF
ncbi:outer membrane beta-barrel protein [Ferruginibacter yonginensis]|uniref:Outer membrane beta-barrel protein n=1 Tax=Ferruginibacter yonginensis TaxID=1310416 RepID=A0ABV8QN02_9BACT